MTGLKASGGGTRELAVATGHAWSRVVDYGIHAGAKPRLGASLTCTFGKEGLQCTSAVTSQLNVVEWRGVSDAPLLMVGKELRDIYYVMEDRDAAMKRPTKLTFCWTRTSCTIRQDGLVLSKYQSKYSSKK